LAELFSGDPEVLQSTRLFNFVGTGSFFCKKLAIKYLKKKKCLAADSNFFAVFSAKLLQGNASNCLTKEKIQ